MILAVEIRRKIFGENGAEVLRDLRFTLAEREIVALVGPSGCGKTTLLNIVSGLDRDYEGSVVWPDDRRPRIGAVFQEPRLLPWRTIRENLQLVLPEGVGPARGEALLDLLGLGAFRDSYPAQLSTGMARRAAIVRAFAIDPELLLLDEPFVSLDAAMAETSRNLLLDVWRRQPTTALIVTHDLVEAASLADRILMLSRSPATILADLTVPEAVRRAGAAAAAGFAENIRALAAAQALA